VPARPRSGFAHPCFIHNPASIKKRFEILRSYNAKTIISACLPAGLWIKHLLGICKIAIVVFFSINHNLPESSILIEKSHRFGYKRIQSISDSHIPTALKWLILLI